MFPKPWIEIIAREFINYIIDNGNKSFNIFEWGAGGSTLWFGMKRVGKVISVEYDIEWYNKINEEIQLLNIDVNLLYKPAKEEVGCEHSLSMKNLNFLEYINAINNQNFIYDLIFIDGRARVMCFNNAIEYIKPNGYIILHDSERKMYDKCRDISNNKSFIISEIVEERSTLICQKI